MPAFTVNRPNRRDLLRRCQLAVSLVTLLAAVALPGVASVAGRTVDVPGAAEPVAGAAPDHLVISEVVTGGASASDEFIEIHNPTSIARSLAGLELIYVSASGATVTRKAIWTEADPAVEPGGHLLVANEAGTYAAAADATYANGLAATGGSVALRIVGAGTAVDALGWGSAASSWLEGSPAGAPAAGHSLERLPGGAEGSGRDTDVNADDFVERATPDPQGSTSDPTPGGTPSATPMPTPTSAPTATPTPPPAPTPTLLPTATATPIATPTPMPTATPAAVLSIAVARGLPDGTRVTVEGVSLTDGAFSDGGGYLADGSAGIAVLVSGGSFLRGALLRVSGVVDDRYHQRTIRSVPEDIAVIGSGDEPAASQVATGEVGEPLEGLPVRVEGTIVSGKTQLTGGVAFDLDDGGGAARVVVLDTTGIDTSLMLRGASLGLVGIVGQRDSSGTGAEGYRIQPRDAADILELAGPAPTGSPTPAPTPSPGVDATLPIAEARLASANTRVSVRGVVTLPSSVLDDGTAAVQDETGAIVLRLGDEAGTLQLGQLVLVHGVRSTKAGMETIRISEPPLQLGLAGQPAPRATATGAVGEPLEAMLISVTGVVTAGPQRTSARNVYFDLDDGSGPVRVFLTPGTGIDGVEIVQGTGMQVIGVVGQETSGQQPLRGYRVWPRTAGDLRVLGHAEPALVRGTDGTAATGATRSSAVSPTGSPVALPVLPVPRLAIASAVPRSLPAMPTPHPDSERLAVDPAPLAPLPMALVAVVLASGAGVLAAHRPGLAGRLREALARLAAPDGKQHADASPGAPPPRSIEGAADQLVPLRVIQGATRDGVGSRGDRTAPRSERILPPT